MFIKPVFAQITNPAIPAFQGTGYEVKLGAFIGSLIGVLIIISLIATMLYFIMGALDWVTSGGDKTKLEQAQKKITNSIIGIIVAASVWAVMLIVSQFLGFDFPNINLPRLTGEVDESAEGLIEEAGSALDESEFDFSDMPGIP